MGVSREGFPKGPDGASRAIEVHHAEESHQFLIHFGGSGHGTYLNIVWPPSIAPSSLQLLPHGTAVTPHYAGIHSIDHSKQLILRYLCSLPDMLVGVLCTVVIKTDFRASSPTSRM